MFRHFRHLQGAYTKVLLEHPINNFCNGHDLLSCQCTVLIAVCFNEILVLKSLQVVTMPTHVAAKK
jgi:hypothetical protein